MLINDRQAKEFSDFIEEISTIGFEVVLSITGKNVLIESFILEAITLNVTNWLLGINVNSNLLLKIYVSIKGYVEISEL